MSTAAGALSAIRRLSIVIAIAIVFVFGLATTVYLSLRSPEVKVPDVLGKDRFEAERVLSAAGLNFRVRATRPSSQVSANTVLFQVPRGGEVVKAGQTVAMDVSRALKEGEFSETVTPEPSPEKSAEEQTNESNSANENKPRHNRNTNKNANDNTNTGNRNVNNNTGNRNSNNNGNHNANSNRPVTNRNANTGNTNSGHNLNANRPAVSPNSNVNHSVIQNENRRPPVVRPSP